MLSLTHSIDNCVWVCMIRPFKMAVLLFSVYHCLTYTLLLMTDLPLNTYLPLARLVIVLIFRSLDQNLYLHHDNLSKEHEGLSPQLVSLITDEPTDVNSTSITGNTLPKTAAIMSHNTICFTWWSMLQDLASDMYSPPVH